MKKFIYWCPNINECDNRDYVIIEKNKESIEHCEKCASKMKLMGEKTYGGTQRFKNMSTNEKRNVLKKRSLEHNKKEINDKRNDIDKKFKNDIREKFGISKKHFK